MSFTNYSANLQRLGELSLIRDRRPLTVDEERERMELLEKVETFQWEHELEEFAREH